MSVMTEMEGANSYEYEDVLSRRSEEGWRLVAASAVWLPPETDGYDVGQVIHFLYFEQEVEE